MTPEQSRLAAAFDEAAASSAWYRVDDQFDTLMWAGQPEGTPADALGRLWTEPTYRKLVFVSIARHENARTWSVVVRRSSYPWSPTSENQVSFTHAVKILQDPTSLWA